MGIRLPKYFTKTWQTLFSSSLHSRSSSKAKDSHVENGRSRAPSQSNEQSRGEQGGASENNHLNPDPLNVVQHAQHSPDIAVRRSQVEIQDPPTEVQRRPEETRSPAPIRNFPEEVPQPVVPGGVEHSEESSSEIFGVRKTQKVW